MIGKMHGCRNRMRINLLLYSVCNDRFFLNEASRGTENLMQRDGVGSIVFVMVEISCLIYF